MKSILNKFTIRSLKLNIKRTIATCIGIILSTALICAVAGVFSSFQQTLVENAKKTDGDYHTIFYEVPSDEQKYILQNRNVESYGITQGIGYSKLEGCTNEYKPYLYLMEFDQTALNSLGLILEEGRMPENSNELIISKHIEQNGGVKYNIGQKITLEIGKRMAGNEELNQHNPYSNPKDIEDAGYMEEELVQLEKREFTIVGIIKRPNMEMEEYTAPGYTVITTLNEIKDKANIAVKFTNIKDTYNLTKEIAEDKTVPVTNPDIWIPKYNFNTNTELLRWSGVSKSDDTMLMLYSLAGIVIGIIIISSVFVIRNSFAISITEKMKQYGMLASIGATKKQIKKNVLFEGMLLGLISIPIGILGGVLATFILIQITAVLVGSSAFSTQIDFVFNMPILVVIASIILGFVTIYLSCIFSARKAAKISPIDAIRSNSDIKIKAKKIKAPKIIKKLFGVGGEIAYKNLKRNKKKYRTTVISLVVSITVFISLTTFMNYTFDMSGMYYREMDYNINVNIHYQNEEVEYQRKRYQYFINLVNRYNLEEYAIYKKIYINTDLTDKITEEYRQTYERIYEFGYMSLDITAVSENEYKRYVKEIGGKYKDYKDGIIFYDNSHRYNGEGEKIAALNLQENDIITGTLENTEQSIELKIVKVTDEAPMGAPSSTSFGMFIISEELINALSDSFYCNPSMIINAKNPNELCKKIEEEHSNLQIDDKPQLYIVNYKEQAEEQNRMVLLISIFLYGFITVISLIGVTNIFNTITTNMNLRSKEFAMLKSIGMTKKEFDRMINLESMFYGIKSLIIGITLGLGISYWIYKVVIGADVTSGFGFLFPTKPIIISIVFIVIIVGIIMRYSLNKINKQNIIETIRNENI